MPNHYHSNRPGGGRPWNGGGFRGDNRFPPRGGHNAWHGDRDQSPSHTSGSQELKTLLGGELFPGCESPSLRLDKFVTIGSKMKLREIEAMVKLHNRRKPQQNGFVPRADFSQFVGTLRSNLIINQAGGVLENAGISIHPHFNVPFLPGSAVKGVARHAAWCEWRAESDEAKKAEIAGCIAEVFGYPTGDARPKEGPYRGGPDAYLDDYLAARGWKDRKASGSVAFMAAFPCNEKGEAAPATLAVDILTPHGGNDWTDPVPNPFPVVAKGTSFKFAAGPVGFCEKKLVDRAVDWLKIGLTQGGLGAKTAAGYGVFVIPDEVASAAAKSYTLRLVSPAFLRGAEGDEGTLRESSLRGVLRYWWRMLFRSVLSKTDLDALETKVWGGAGKPPDASQIVIRLVQAKPATVVPFDKDAIARSLPRSFRQNRTTGLAYASYGMDEAKKVNGNKVRMQRKVALPGAEWTLEVSFRPRGGVSADILAVHAELAIKAFCTFGGIGSKSRKGFGSMDCGMELDVGDKELWSAMADAVAPFGFAFDPDKAGEYSFLSENITESLSVPLGTRDAWAAVDRIGFALQSTATSFKHNGKKAAAGLPRKIHGPLKYPLPHQQGRRHTPPENLRPEGGTLQRATRFASPLFVHVAPGENGNLRVNAIAFPSGLVRPVDDSSEVLEAYLEDLRDILQETAWN